MNYLQKKKLAFMSIVNSVKGFIRTITGVFPLTLTNCVDEGSVIDYKVYGASGGMGDYEEGSGKYKILIRVSGKNLLDISKAENGSITGANGNGKEENNRVRTDYIYVTAGTYCVSTVGTANDIRCGTICHMYSSNSETSWLGSVNSHTGSIYTGTRNYSLFNVGRDCYIRIPFLPTSTSYIADLTSDKLADYQPQIEKSSTATDYEPYHEPITTKIYLDEPLEQGQSISYKKDNLPTIPTFKGTTILTADTTTQPSNAEVTYYSTLKE